METIQCNFIWPGENLKGCSVGTVPAKSEDGQSCRSCRRGEGRLFSKLVLAAKLINNICRVGEAGKSVRTRKVNNLIKLVWNSLTRFASSSLVNFETGLWEITWGNWGFCMLRAGDAETVRDFSVDLQMYRNVEELQRTKEKRVLENFGNFLPCMS